MKNLNLSLANIAVIATESSLTSFKGSRLDLVHFTLYMCNGDVIEFKSLSAGIKLVGTSTLNGKRVAVKAALNDCKWYKQFNDMLTRNDDLATELLNCYFLNMSGKFTRIVNTTCELTVVTSPQVSFEESLYKAFRDYRYDNFTLNSLNLFLKSTWIQLRESLVGDDLEKARNTVVELQQLCASFLEDYPQFHGNIKKGVVLNMFYSVSSVYSCKYKPLDIQRKATYSKELFVARLLRYLNFRTKNVFSKLEFEEAMLAFFNREAPFIKAEKSEDMARDIRVVSRSFMSAVTSGAYVDRISAIRVLQQYV